jgi:uncharacterized protein (TIGR01244 family)
MWPFSKPDPSHVAHRRIDDAFSVTGQLLPEQITAVSALGFRSILCARPDREEAGQPGFAEVAAAAKAAGLAAVHIPVSGQLTEGALIRMEQALKDLPGPILGYCRSGARAGSLYAAMRR